MMNEKIKQFAQQARQEFLELPTGYTAEQVGMYPQLMERFAQLIVGECLNECRMEWYELNGGNTVGDENQLADPRATGIRVGQKNGVLKCMSRIKSHFGIKE